jgi:glycosyltransferase involved in cell wall biosynthesis
MSEAFLDAVIIAAREPTATIQSARKYCTGVKWLQTCGKIRDFASARNDGLQLSQAEWVLTIDSDEILTGTVSPKIFHQILRQSECVIFSIPVRLWDNGEMTSGAFTVGPRLFRREGIRYVQRIDETPVGFDPQKVGSIDVIQINHRPQPPEVIIQKEELRREIYELELSERPDNPRMWYSYSNNLATCSRWTEVVTAVQRAFELFGKAKVDIRNTRFIELYYIIGAALFNLEQENDALRYIQEGRSLQPDYFDLLHLEILIRQKQIERLEVAHELAAAKWKAEIHSRPYTVLSGGLPVPMGFSRDTEDYREDLERLAVAEKSE